MKRFRVIGSALHRSMPRRHVYDFDTEELARGFYNVSHLTAVWVGWELIDMRTHAVLDSKGET